MYQYQIEHNLMWLSQKEHSQTAHSQNGLQPRDGLLNTPRPKRQICFLPLFNLGSPHVNLKSIFKKAPEIPQTRVNVIKPFFKQELCITQFVMYISYNEPTLANWLKISSPQ